MVKNPGCKIGKITPKDKKVIILDQTRIYKSPEDVLSFTREFFDVLRLETVRSVGIIYETDEGTGSNFIITPKATFSTMIAQCDVLKHKVIETYLKD